MAKEEVPAFDPWKRESYSESTGLIDDVDVSILSLKYGQTDYQGKQPLTTALLMSFKDEEGKVYNEIYSIGAAGNKRFKPSKDGENLVNKDGSPAGGTLNLKSKAAMLVGSFLDAGASFRKTSDAVGMTVHLKRKTLPPLEGVKDSKETTILLVSEIKGGAGKASGSAAGGSDIDKSAETEVLAAIAEAEGGTLTLADLRKAVFKRVKGTQDAQAIVKKASDEEWLAGLDSVMVDEGSVSAV